MTDDPHDPGAEQLPGARPPATPTWVKVLGLAVLLLVVLIAVALLTGGAGGHGPGRHAA